jgi:uncharacterized protein (TIGR01777 family)
VDYKNIAFYFIKLIHKVIFTQAKQLFMPKHLIFLELNEQNNSYNTNMIKKHVLITGATGMVGKSLIQTLTNSGYTISVLSRSSKPIKGTTVFVWNIDKGEIDATCLADVDTILHLAGEGIAAKKWTSQRKQQIIDSRVKSTALLFDTLKHHANCVNNFISASAVGYYGNRGDEILNEDSINGTGFLADCCVLWENAVDEMINLGLRVAKIRIGVVLSKNGGALPELEQPIRFFVGAPLGSGQQWIPWIHLDDLVNIFTHAIENTLIMGAYNACAPYPVRNATLTRAVAKQLHRPVWPIKVPEKIMKLILGEMSEVVLNSTDTSAQKILQTGFTFKYTRLEEALSHIYAS